MKTGHFEDKVRHCDNCHKDVHIPHNQVGGFWHLSGWEDKDGKKHYGGMCSECFGEMSDAKRYAEYEKTYGHPYKGIGK
jgi:hypothetical protein